ncbi:MAG: hypothetical protein QXY70_01285 [Nanopusillaceae archaeon]
MALFIKVMENTPGNFLIQVLSFDWHGSNCNTIPYAMWENGMFDSPPDSIGGPVKSMTCIGFQDNQIREIYGNLGGSSFVEGGNNDYQENFNNSIFGINLDGKEKSNLFD